MSNVRGLSDRKFISISDYFHSTNLDFCCIQETMISDETIQSSFSSRWCGPSFWAPAVGKRGVLRFCVLIVSKIAFGLTKGLGWACS